MGSPVAPGGGRPYRELRSLREDTLLTLRPDGPVVLQGPWGTRRLEVSAEAVREALRRMSYGPVSLTNVVPDYPDWDAVRGAGPSEDALRLRAVLAGLTHCVVASLATDGGSLLLSVVPLTRTGHREPRPGRPGERYRLSRYVWARSDRDGLRLESPVSGSRLELHGEAVALLGALPVPPGPGLTVGQLAERLAGRPPRATVRAVLAYLVAAGVVVRSRPHPVSGRPEFAEDADPVYRSAAVRGAGLYRASRAVEQSGELLRGWTRLAG
ncbi:hypothetical protein [Kitasatospora sp. NPDC087314]|uniref:hypothetical protein n=1 Tax=Kitasatospora sp. NPDC087314 TaxID=3364068 RepID=UPI003814E94C